MKPIGPLMWEHRLIERVLDLMKKELETIRKGIIDPNFVNSILDFHKTYAEKLHFIKEEDILFSSLSKKRLSAELNHTMTELIEEHASLRKKVDIIASINKEIDKVSNKQLDYITKSIEEMLELYPSHMEKEDKHFFYPCLGYLSQSEQDDMLVTFHEFDSKVIHGKYQDIVTSLEIS